jgi:hypothetical protein
MADHNHRNAQIVARSFVTALGAADPGIGKHRNHIPAVPLGDCLKLALLIFDGLLCCGDPEIESDAFRHDAIIAWVYTINPVACPHEQAETFCDIWEMGAQQKPLLTQYSCVSLDDSSCEEFPIRT